MREIVTELLAIQCLLRWAPARETFEEFAERLRELLQDFDVRGSLSRSIISPEVITSLKRCYDDTTIKSNERSL